MLAVSVGGMADPPQADVLARFHVWMLASGRQEGTIRLRMRHLHALSEAVDVVRVDTEGLERFLASWRHLAPETRKSALASWRVFFGWAHQRGIRPDNPTADMQSIRVPVRLPRVAADHDIALALEVATPPQRAMVLLARYACLRLSELTALHTAAREGEQLRIIGKGDKERLVYVNEPLLFALHGLERTQGRGYYFPGRRQDHMHPMSVNKIITRITGWNPHSLRHAGATAAYRATGDLRAVQEMLGHASLATTQRYLHLDDAARRRVADATVIRERQRIAA